MKLLVVCAANICRSPGAEVLFNQAFRASDVLSGAQIPIQVSSAGTNAVQGSARCVTSSAITGPHVGDGSVELTIDLIANSDLILATGKTQRGLIVKSAPRFRNRIFTLRECANLAQYITSTGLALDAASGLVNLEESPIDLDQVPPLPTSPDERVTWFLNELDAWRGQNPVAPDDVNFESLDIPDPHDARNDIHPETFTLISEAVAQFTSALELVLSR